MKLRKVRDIKPQLTNAEWIASFPGSPEQKKFLYGCVGCHTLERVAKSKHDAAGFQAVMKFLAGFANNSHVKRPHVPLVARVPLPHIVPDFHNAATSHPPVHHIPG